MGTLKWQKMANTTVVLSGAIPDGGPPAWRAPAVRDAPPGPLDDAASAPLRWPLTAHATKRLTSGATTMIGRGCRSHSYSDAKRRLSLDCGITDQHPKRGVMTYMQHLEHITAAV